MREKIANRYRNRLPTDQIIWIEASLATYSDCPSL